MLQHATLEKSGMLPEDIERLRNRMRDLPTLAQDPKLRLWLRAFLANGHSEEVYRANRHAINEYTPDAEVPSYEHLQRIVTELTGVVGIKTDMCPRSCLAYSGPFADLEECPLCPEREPRYKMSGTQRVPRLTFQTFPFGPQAQTQYLSPENARDVEWRRETTQELLDSLLGGSPLGDIQDFCWGTDYLHAVQEGRIKPDDMTLMFSIDGAQLYESKQSDCWVYIWVIFELGPEKRYKKRYVLPGAIIPGLMIWDAHAQRLFKSFPIIIFVCADGPGMSSINGLVGHSGAQGCRLYCSLRGRRKPHSAHYCLAMLKPLDYYERGCDHPDSRVCSVGSPGTLVSRGASLATSCSLNIADLYIPLLRGTFRCDKTDNVSTWDWACLKLEDVWEEHGRLVGEASLYLPGSFGRAPRNPAEKIHSSYKAWEFQYYVFGELPCFLWSIQKPLYHAHFCKLVSGVQTALLLTIPGDRRKTSHTRLLEFEQEYEELYYQRRVDRLHFVRQSIHALIHLIPESKRVGPGSLHSQWTIENAIGNLTREIGSDVAPYANLAERSLRRAQVNALQAMFPELGPPEKDLPHGAIVLGDGYVLMRARDRASRHITGAEARELISFLATRGIEAEGWEPADRKWARVRLPNGQTAKSAWKESERERQGQDVRLARMVKLRNGRFAEVQYFFRLELPSGEELSLAMASEFTAPDPSILRDT
ncbi:hypothetical protein OH77DRAFT_1499673 [Trametes cingulata]|nr:hypothetical protein OH77DRAFT_1499673 [Trametes cingulata]